MKAIQAEPKDDACRLHHAILPKTQWMLGQRLPFAIPLRSHFQALNDITNNNIFKTQQIYGEIKP